MPTYSQASDSHTPYSPSHVSYSRDPPSIEPLGPTHNSPREHSGSLPTVLQSAQARGELLVHVEGSTILPSPQAGIEPQSQNGNDHVPYSPSYAPVSPTDQDTTEVMVREGSNRLDFVDCSPSYVPALLSQPDRANQPIVQEDNPHVPYIPVSTTTQVHNDCSRGSLREVTVLGLNRVTSQSRETSVQDGSLDQEFLRLPEIPIRRWIQPNRRRWVRRFRSTVPHRVNPYLGAFSSERSILGNVTIPRRAIETNNDTHKTCSEGLVGEDSEEGRKEHTGGAGQFDCNICFDMAKEPVVTSCGHLFCWPCLYQWLHHHCDHKECPVCKGEVRESMITPIYGRGSSDMGLEKGHEDGNSGFKVPPRPRGRRFESLRQQIRRLPSQRLGEEIDSMGHIVDEEIRDGNGFDGQEEATMGGMFDEAAPFLTRFMAGQRLQRWNYLENGLDLWRNSSSRNTTEMTLNNIHNGNSIWDDHHRGRTRSTPPALAQHEIEYFLPRLSSYSVTGSDRLATISGDHSSTMGNISNGGTHSGVPLSAAHPQDYNPIEAVFPADQTSDSSTMAVIRGDTGAPIDDPTEPNSMGSSSSLRRRRNSTSGSLDVYGGFHHASKRRRLN